MLLIGLTADAQDFDLYYAKNVTDATQFSDLKLLDKELTWRKMDKEAIDGNQDEVAAVTEMLRSTRMKDLADQQQFWRMRDHTLLCFRINDGSGTTGTYHVEVNYGTDTKGNALRQSLTTSSYFFANMPLQEQPITVRVWRTNHPDDYYQLRYWVYDWNDENTYIFQLDQKRQSTGDTYRMQYVTSYANEEDEAQTETNTLELRATAFQSFQLPEGHSLTELYFLTGNSAEGDVKLKVDVSNLHPGIDIDKKFNIPQLTPTFVFDKHERREMMNFNWMGTGLFEKYDTLYLKLFNQKGRIVNRANINVQRVDANGNKVDDTSLRYLGYDELREEHRTYQRHRPQAFRQPDIGREHRCPASSMAMHRACNIPQR